MNTDSDIAEKRQASAQVTPEAIEAGVDVLLSYVPGEDDAWDVVTWIFEAMLQAQGRLLVRAVPRPLLLHQSVGRIDEVR